MTNYFKQSDYPDLIAGLEQPDDAAVWRLDEDRSLVITTDFFTPVVDDPYDYGSIAAANSISDIYAMGAKPFLALNIAAMPTDLPLEIVTEIFRGGMEKAKEAGVVIAGGHTIQDKEPKYGLIVLGFAKPGEILTKGGMQEGDILLLSKPLGTGVITTALKQGKADMRHVESAVEKMKQLNAESGRAALEMGAHAATDITGFGFLGHAWEMAQASGLGLQIRIEDIPLVDGAEEYARRGIFPGGAFDNREFFRAHVVFKNIPEENQMLLFDPQTSGGLLVSANKEDFRQFVNDSEKESIFKEIGRVVSSQSIEIS